MGDTCTPWLIHVNVWQKPLKYHKVISLQLKLINYLIIFKKLSKDFPGSPGVKTPPSNARGMGLIPGGGTKSPHALRPKKQKRKP